ncbi:MAG: KGK domain-containing protein [Planktothrix sp. GU0601_MAG3]|nr:MAG: KGK domain-containing protein [Planktothrix sp. GU0601_MAG3]
MTESFIKLEQDNDIVMLGKDTFTVSRLKELMTENMKVRLFSGHPELSGHSLPVVLCKNLEITDKSIQLKLNEFRLVFPPNGIDGQLLQLISGQWISGKIRFQVDANNQGHIVNTELEFAADEIIPNEEEQKNINYDNSLDKIRAELNEMKAI